MTVTIMVEREGKAPALTPEMEHELEETVRLALATVVRGGGDYQSQRITVAVRGEK